MNVRILEGYWEKLKKVNRYGTLISEAETQSLGDIRLYSLQKLLVLVVYLEFGGVYEDGSGM